MRVLLAASEAYPLIKTGGLADVAGALPAALSELNIDARIVLPGYPQALDTARLKGQSIAVGDVLGMGPTRLIPGETPDSGRPVWLVDNPRLFDRPGGPYQLPDGREHPDNHARFALLSRVAALLAVGEAVPDWAADVVHANDWQTGLVPAYLKLAGRTAPKSCFTIHNLHFQGVFDPAILAQIGVPARAFAIDGVEFHGSVSYLKAGLYYADRLTTVSPTYAWEITTPEGGRGLHGLLDLRAVAGELKGILNGVDYALWDPRHDSLIETPYGPTDVEAGKRANKAALQRELGLDAEAGAPLLGVVSRFSDQKGIDLVADAAVHLIDSGAQLVVQGSGDAGLEARIGALSGAYPGRVAVRIGYDEPMAHRIQAASDIFLVPSRFEPCGLTQLYALRYGALPLVRRTGGLADTVRDLSQDETGTGFVFDAPSTEGLLSAFHRALGLWRRPEAWHAARLRAMAEDFGWQRAAEAYASLYRDMLRA